MQRRHRKTDRKSSRQGSHPHFGRGRPSLATNVARTAVTLVVIIVGTVAIVVYMHLVARHLAAANADVHVGVARAMTPEGDVFHLAATEVTTEASFFKAEVSGVPVVFFAVRDDSAAVHIALDRCDARACRTPGYVQQGNAMQCLSCKKTFPVAGLSEKGEQDECKPVALPAILDGDSFSIARADIEAGVRLFEKP